MKKNLLKKMFAGVAVIGLLSGCSSTGNDTGGLVHQSQTQSHPEPVHAAQLPGDMTYQDVLQKGGNIQTIFLSADSRIWMGTHLGLYASASERLWSSVSKDLAEDDISGLYVDPDAPNHIYIGGDKVSKRSEDGGKTWKQAARGLPLNADINSISGYKEGGRVCLFAYVNEEGIYSSLDFGDHWEQIVPVDKGIYSIDYSQEEKELFVLTQDGLQTLENGTWGNETIPDAEQIYALAVSNDHKIYVSTDKGIMVKVNGEWLAIPEKAPEHLILMAQGAGDISLVGIGESGFLYSLVNGKWQKWE